MVTNQQIEALKQAAGQAGDSRQIGLCAIALGEDLSTYKNIGEADREWLSRHTAASARIECVSVICDDLE